MSPATRLLRQLVLLYRRLLSPLLPPRCRFAPSCSTYALEALEVHGALRGTGLAVGRVLRCHPFHPGGHDPVPPARSSTARRPAVAVVSDDAGVSTGRPAAGRPSPARPAPGLGALS